MKTRLAILTFAALAIACGNEEPAPDSQATSPVAAPMVTRKGVIAETEAGATAVVVLEDDTLAFPADKIAPGPVVFTVRNAGNQLHSFAIEGPGVDVRLEDNLANGEEGTLEATFTPGAYRAWCPLHQDRPAETVEFQVASP